MNSTKILKNIKKKNKVWGRRDLRVHANQHCILHGKKVMLRDSDIFGNATDSYKAQHEPLASLIPRLCFPWSFCTASWDIYESSWASIHINIMLADGVALNNRRLLFHSFEGGKSKIKGKWAWFLPEASLLGFLPMATFLLCPHVVCPLCVHTRGTSVLSFLFMEG